MGRHARGAAGLRVSVSTIVLGTLIVTVVAAGSLLSSYAQPTQIAAPGVEGVAVENTVTDGRLLPYGLVLAALLVVGAAAAVWVDARRDRRSRALAAHRVADTSAPPEAVASADVPSVAGASGDSWSTNAFGELDETMLVPAEKPLSVAESRGPVGRHARPEPDHGETSWSGASLPASRLTTVDLTFPFTASLAASLHDELFTHRTVTS